MEIPFVNIHKGVGNCANFLSQSLIESGHPKLNESPCKKFKCDIQLGSRNLSQCPVKKFKWRREFKKKITSS